MANRHILNLVVNSHTNAAILGTPAVEACFPYSLTIRIQKYLQLQQEGEGQQIQRGQPEGKGWQMWRGQQEGEELMWRS